MAHHTSFLSRHHDVIASFSFGTWRVKSCFHDKRIFCSTANTSILFQHLRSSTVLSMTMSSPGQRRGTCGHAMAGFDTHSKCTRCRDKGVGDDPCVLKKECGVCKGFTPEQIQQLATPTYRDRKEKKATASSSAPTLVDPAYVSVLGKVEKDKASQPQSTPTAKKTKRSESPKPSASKKKSTSSRPSAEDQKQLDDKWAERFSRLEAMLLAKTFTVPVEPVVKPASDVTISQKPFFDPSARCLTRVQDSMSTPLKTLHLDSKGKSSEKVKQAVNELEYLTTFSWSISQAMARTMQDLSEGVFINMANFTLARNDSYLDYLHAGVKQDTVNALRTSPVHLNSLFPDQLITKAEEEICRSEERCSSGTSHRHQGRFHPYAASDKSTGHHDRKSTLPAWKQIKDKQQARKGLGKASTFSQKPAKGSKSHK